MGSAPSYDLSRYVRKIGAADMRRAAELSGYAQLEHIREALRASGIRDLLTREGIAIVTALDEVEPAGWPAIFLQVCRSLGSLLSQSVSEPHQLVREIRYREGNLSSRATRYSDSRDGGSFHSDGVPIPGALPDLLALLCVRQALTGGELVFIDSALLIARAVERMPSLVEVLSAPFHFDQRRSDDTRATVVRQIVETSAQNKLFLRLVYLRDYVESGHAIDGVRPLTRAEIEAMDALDSVMADEALHIEGRLTAGQIALSDNRRYLHGRHAFRDPPGTGAERLLLRCWIRERRAE